jgi:hypothetical protein
MTIFLLLSNFEFHAEGFSDFAPASKITAPKLFLVQALISHPLMGQFQ